MPTSMSPDERTPFSTTNKSVQNNPAVKNKKTYYITLFAAVSTALALAATGSSAADRYSSSASGVGVGDGGGIRSSSVLSIDAFEDPTVLLLDTDTDTDNFEENSLLIHQEEGKKTCTKSTATADDYGCNAFEYCECSNTRDNCLCEQLKLPGTECEYNYECYKGDCSLNSPTGRKGCVLPIQLKNSIL